MSKTLVLHPSSDTDISSVVPMKKDELNQNKLAGSNTSAVNDFAGLSRFGRFRQVVTTPKTSMGGKKIEKLNATSSINIGQEDLLTDINDFLTAHFSVISMSEVAHSIVRTETLEPNVSQVQAVHRFVADMRNLITRRGLKWYEPTISCDEYNNATEISWWRVDRSLIVTVELGSPVTFLKVWGADIYNDMEDGESPSGDQLIALWQWLYA